MWSAGVVDVGLTSKQFWSLTPNEFSWLFERHIERENRADRRAALVAMYIANWAGRMRKEGASPLGIEEILGARVEPLSEMEQLRRATQDPLGALREQAQDGDPNVEVAYSQAVLDMAGRGLGTWGKLGTRLMQPVALIKAMNPGWKQ